MRRRTRHGLTASLLAFSLLGAVPLAPGAAADHPTPAPTVAGSPSPDLSPTPADPDATPTSTAEPTATATPKPSVTWSPDAKRKVTVDQTTQLVNQVVKVSWSGFTPSSDTFLTDSTLHVVRVYQCRGKAPASVADCYGSGGYDYPGKAKGASVLPDGPTNAVTTITQKNGRGTAEIEVRTIRESASLGCQGEEDCSLVIVPNDGDPARPELVGQLGNTSNLDSEWAWAGRVVVPISFAASSSTCELADADVRASGSAQARRLIEQWQPGLCRAKEEVDLDFTSLGEPQARAAFSSKSIDMAVTSRPDTNAPGRPFTYAPVGISGIAIAYRIDDADTGKPITDLKLTPRLVAKLITESYGMSATCTDGVEDCNKAVKGNPQEIFQDPEFLKLNGEEHSWPSSGWPLVVSGENDLAYELTRWLKSDADTRAFLAGARAPGGMKVNRNFKGISYPANSFEARDPDKRFIHGYIPLLGLGEVARFLVTNRDNSENYVKDAKGNYVKTAPYPVGGRGLIAIVSTSDSEALRFPVARIRNAAGAYVAPTDGSMQAALRHLKSSGGGVTQEVDHTAKDARTYPLTMVHYAMAPTNGLEKGTAQKIARLLDHAAGAGQKAGTGPGTRPVGYIPLTSAMRAQTRKAAAEVLAQKGTLPEPPADAPPSVQTPASQPPAVSLPLITENAAPMGGRLSADAGALIGWLLPVLLGVGVASALIGPVLYGTGRFGGPGGVLPRRGHRGRRRSS